MAFSCMRCNTSGEAPGKLCKQNKQNQREKFVYWMYIDCILPHPQRIITHSHDWLLCFSRGLISCVHIPRSLCGDTSTIRFLCSRSRLYLHRGEALGCEHFINQLNGLGARSLAAEEKKKKVTAAKQEQHHYHQQHQEQHHHDEITVRTCP